MIEDKKADNIVITLLNGQKKEMPRNVTGFDVVKEFFGSSREKVLVIEVNKKLQDLSIPIKNDSFIRFITIEDLESLEIIRHDAAHIAAQAVKELFPEVKIANGPATENGFYYDFQKTEPFSIEDLFIIEERMHEIVKRDEKIERYIWDRDSVIKFFKSYGENYKVEIVSSIPEDQDITLYKQGNFIDLCRGPHVSSTGKIKFFKLLKVSGVSWRGNNNNVLQRIYGTAWRSEEELNNYLTFLDEAEKRDHRKIGKMLDLFHFQDEAQGMVFFHNKGWIIYSILEKYIRNKMQKDNYLEVKTPLLLDKSLWEKSGHWDKFKNDMFILEHFNKKTYALKPMNCPCHIQIFNFGIKSYKDLPLRMSEFGLCHRDEASGALHGLMRVRALTQDDGHIFCTEEQISEETKRFCKLLMEVYKDFGFSNISIKFSDRPDIRAGSDEIWSKAEDALMKAITEAGYNFLLSKGNGAFYGPKLEFCLKDSIGREWQCGTLQVDFVLPERFDANYIDSNGNRKRPVMLHRAIFGSIERFLGILIEDYAGAFPIWLAPVQVAIATITSHTTEYALHVHNTLQDFNIRSSINISSDKIQSKIRDLSIQKIPIIAVIGKKEEASNTVSIRRLGSQEQQIISIVDLKKIVEKENNTYLI